MKEKIVAALLAFFLGEWGIHRFYLDEQESGKNYLVWCVVGILTSWLLIGFIPLIVLFIKKLIDCFTYLFMTDYEFDVKYNHIERPEKEILND